MDQGVRMPMFYHSRWFQIPRRSCCSILHSE